MNVSVSNVAGPDIKANLGISFDQVNWIMAAYFVGNLVIMPVSAWLSWMLGRRNYFLITVLLFTVCSFFCGHATGIGGLIIFRFLQGLGGGGMLVLSHTVITESWPVEKRATAQVFVISGILAGKVLTGPIGGYITDNYSWSFVFFANIPAGIIAGVFVLAFVRNGSYERAAIDITLAGLIQNVHIRTALVLSFLTAVGITGSTINPTSLVVTGIPAPINILWFTVLAVVVLLVVTAVVIENTNGLRYVITAGLLLLAISCYMSSSFASVDLNWLLPVRGIAITSLSLAVSTLMLTRLKGEQIGQGVALYNMMQQLGGVIGILLFSV
ncbi:MFS transporter [Chitinophaga varians]|nr:MFS transporter [Chitinophaga varians]